MSSGQTSSTNDLTPSSIENGSFTTGQNVNGTALGPMPAAGIAGIAVGAAAIFAVLALAVYLFARHVKRRRSPDRWPDGPTLDQSALFIGARAKPERRLETADGVGNDEPPPTR
jgi:hypothetical protein